MNLVHPSNVQGSSRSRAVASRLFVRGLMIACMVVASVVPNRDVLAQPGSSEQIIQQLQAIRAAGDTSPEAAQALKKIESAIADSAPYALRRELAKTRMFVLQDSLDSEEALKAVESLRKLAEAKGDVDTVSLMDIRRIYMSHADDDIGKFIGQLNEVRAKIRSDASPEVMEALELSYGNMYFDAGNFDTALRHQLAALDWAEKLPLGSDRARLFRLGTIADLYNAMELPEQALAYLDQAQAQPNATIPARNRISLLATRVIALMKLDRMGDAEAVFSQVEDLAGSDDSTFTALRIGTLRAEMLLASAKPESALARIDAVETLAGQSGSAYYLARAWLLRGEAQIQLNRVVAGIALMDKAIDFFQGKGQMIDVLDGLDREIRMLREKKQFEGALRLMDRRQQLWSQLFRNERGRAIAEVEALHTAQALEHQVVTLSSENRIQEQRLRAERLGKVLALVLALFAIGVSAWLFRAIRRARGERDRLSEVVRLDALTGAASRYQFQRRHAQTPAAESPGLVKRTLLLLDIDHFKAINDQHGHEAGDAVLKAVVERVRRSVTKDDEIYRWGGEEFLVIFKHRDDESLFQTVLGLLVEIESKPVPWHGQVIAVRISGGWVQHPLDDGWKTPLTDAIRWADAALYHAKNSGRRRIEKVELTDNGRLKLVNRRPVDMPQLLDWQRSGYVNLRTVQSGDSSKKETEELSV